MIVAGAIGLVACASEDPEADEIGQPEIEVQGGAGSNCGIGGEACDEGLTCCNAGGTFLWRCRNLLADNNNCGTCGHVCAQWKHCVGGICVQN